MTKDEIIELRKSLCMTQYQLAVALGTTVASVSRWENGHTLVSPAFKKQLLLFKERNALKPVRPR